MTSAGGGTAAKLGERYEAWWTILAGALPVLAGKFGALLVEEPGTDAIEFRLVDRAGGGPNEAHQCKNSDATSWPVARLAAAGFLDELARQTDLGTVTKFVSSSPSILTKMSKKADRLTFSSWEADLNKLEKSACAELRRVWGTTAEVVHRRLRLAEFRTIDDETLREMVIGGIRGAMEGDSEEALGLIRGYIENHLGEQPITAHELWTALRKKGHRPLPGTDPAVSEVLREVVGNYVEQVEAARPPAMPLVRRAEADRIARLLTADDGPAVVALLGRPGAGKSSVLAQVCRDLASEVVVGVLRLDLASPVTTAAELGRQAAIGFGDAPAVVMARAGAGKPAVLIIDQVDSVSSLSGRDPSVLSALRQVVDQARTTDDLRLLVACRTEDLRFDSKLRHALGLSPFDSAGGSDQTGAVSESEVTEVVLGDLAAEQVASVLGELGLEYDQTSQTLRALLGNALDLGLFVELYSEADDFERESLTAVRTQLDLVAAYHAHVARQMRDRAGGIEYARVAIRLALTMSDTGVLSAPQSVLGDVPATRDLMIHHGVVIKNGGRLRFVHETLLEYLVALGIRQAGTTVVQLLADDPQELLRSGQVRALLALGKAEDDNDTYITDLRGVLDGRLTRSHIRAAVYSMLGECRAVTDAEFEVVFDRAVDSEDRLRRRALSTLAAPPMASAMARRGLLTFVAQRLTDDPPEPRDAHQAMLSGLKPEEISQLLVRFARSSPDATAAAVRMLAEDPTTLDRSVAFLLRIAFMAGPTEDGESIVDLFQAVIRSVADLAINPPPPHFAELATTNDFADADAVVWRIVDMAFNQDGRHALSTIVKNCPRHAARAIAAWLEAAEHISLHHHIGSIFLGYGSRTPLRHEATSLDILETCARSTPLKFVAAVLPVMVRDWERSATHRMWRPAGAPDSAPGLRTVPYMFSYGRRSLRREVLDALYLALSATARTVPADLRPLLRPWADSDLLPVHETFTYAYEHATGPLLADALIWSADPRVRGLDRDLTTGWAWGAVVSHVAASEGADQPAAALDLVMTAYPPTDVPDGVTRESMPADAWERLAVVGQLQARLGDAALPLSLSRALRELERVLGPAPTATLRDIEFTPRDSEETPEKLADLDDEQWISRMAAFSASTEPGDPASAATITALYEQSQRAPGRFARILLAAPAAADLERNVVRGITEVVDSMDAADRPAVMDLIEAVAARERTAAGDLDILHLIRRCGSWSLPAEVVALVPATFRDGPITRRAMGVNFDDPVVVTGLNHVRGTAADTAGALLYAPEHRTERLRILREMIERMGDDPDDSVRVFGPQAFLPVLFEDLELFGQAARAWLANVNDAVLHAPGLGRMMWAAVRTHASLSDDLLRRMLASPDPVVRRRGGNLAVQFAVHVVVLGTEHDPYRLVAALRDPLSRQGVAEFLAQMVDELPKPRPDEGDDAGDRPPVADMELLYRLAEDDDDDVRAQVMEVLRYASGPLIQYAGMLKRLATTRAFADQPGSLLAILSDRRDEMPESVLDLCESWTRSWSATAGDISRGEAADGFYVSDVVFAVYARAAARSPTRARCLALIDELIENEVGSVDAKAERVAYQALTN